MEMSCWCGTGANMDGMDRMDEMDGICETLRRLWFIPPVGGHHCAGAGRMSGRGGEAMSWPMKNPVWVGWL